MPELPPFNPTVSVFHFTSRVSSAKIRKYKLATERGMTNGHVVGGDKAIKRQSSQSSPVPEISEEPKGRARLKLKVRPPDSTPDNDDDTIAAKPSFPSKTTNKRDWNDAFGRDLPAQRLDLLAGDSSSELSPHDSNVSTPKSAQLPARDGSGAAQRAAQRESYGDLMSYYILDDDDDHSDSASTRHEVRTAAPPRKTSRPQRNAGKPRPQIPKASAFSRDSAARAQKPIHRQQKDQHHRQGAASTQPPHQPRPPIQFPSFQPLKLGPPDPLTLMVEKVEALSTALTEFGGASPAETSPEITAHTVSQPDEKRFGHHDTFTASGEGDQALTYGIQFIMNALQSWAQQRLTREHIMSMQQSQHTTSNTAFSGQGLTAMTLAGTPEGRAIAAFRAVVESGCLRVNTMVPVTLSRALRKLYLQIDHLINQGTKQTAPWRCLSYQAQIEANNVRVSVWRDEQARAHQEMIRQHQLSHQQTMRQMGLPTHLTSTMFYQQPQDPLAAYVDQPGDSYNLIRLPMQALDNPLVAHRAAAPPTGALPMTALPPSTHPVVSSANRPPQPQQDVSTSASYLLPRSGQSMHLSFAPTHSAAVQNASHPQHVGPSAPRAVHNDVVAIGSRASNYAGGRAPGLAQQGEQRQTQATRVHGGTRSGFTAINA